MSFHFLHIRCLPSPSWGHRTSPTSEETPSPTSKVVPFTWRSMHTFTHSTLSHNNVVTFMYTSTCTIRWLSHSTLSCKASTDCVQWSVRISGFFCPQFGSQILVGGVRRGEEGRVWWIIISLTRIHAYMCRLRWWRKTRMGQVGVSREQNFVWMCSVKV